jgi:DMSO/TMAO reductase YedYZ molybdopterin-dependent catalytic subunit
MTRRRQALWAGIAGIVAALATLAVAEVAARLVAPASSPVLAVGSLVIDIVPGWLKTLVIDLFGTGDKAALLVTLGVAVLGLAIVAGIAEYRRPPWGIAVLVAVGAVATVAVSTRAGSTALWAVPTVAGMVAGVVVLRLAVDRLHAWAASAATGGSATPENPAATAAAPPLAASTSGPESPRANIDRRGFFVFVGATAAVAVIAGLSARAMNAASVAVTAVRRAIRLPAPVAAAPPIPAGAELAVDGITPLVSANDTFYRIDTALQVPSIDASAWKLRITGMVENEIEIGFEELLALPLIEAYVTLMCVSNEVGGQLAGNAKWLGHPIRELLVRARPLAGADMVLSRSIDGFTASTPLDVLLDENRNSILAVGMNDEPLPLEHGFPVRMVVPGLFGYVSATKWVVELKVTRFADDTAYWTDRGWTERGPVKTSSRIDVPRSGSTVPAGTIAVAGVAWAQHTGIDGVEVRIDGGEWTQATLAEAISSDTWRQWVYEWDAASGDHEIEVRATDAAGTTQSGRPVPVVPDGSEGWHRVSVQVS